MIKETIIDIDIPPPFEQKRTKMRESDDEESKESEKEVEPKTINPRINPRLQSKPEPPSQEK